MTQEKWLESVYSDGSIYFVSSPEPELGETVTIKLRMYADAPIKHVLLRSVPDGVERLTEMTRAEEVHGLVYYSGDLRITEYRMQYQFYLVCEDIIYYYNQKEITTYIPDQTYDFVLLTDYRQPSWVKNSVFYQIFPDRFYNGNPENDVRDGEYQLNGHPAIKIKDWAQEPLRYEQGFCLDFYGGDLEGVKARIPYLKELGVNAVYLNPIFRAPSVHKYDCIDYFHVDPHFGGDAALAELSAALHDHGMKLILDISINHTGTAHKWFNRDALFFDKSQGAYHNPGSAERSYYFFEEGTDHYHGWLGIQDLPTLNYTSAELRKIIYEAENSVIRKWLKPPYSIDGWRFDVADTFARNKEIQLAHEIWPELRKSIREANPDAYILAEDWGDCAPYLQGKEWDSPMNYYGCARVFRQFAGEADLFHARNPLLSRVPYKMTAEDVRDRVMEHLAKLPFALWQNQFNLIDSHDVPRLHNNPAINGDEYRGVVIMQFMLVGTASVYYGDEMQIDGRIADNEGCRAPFPWDRDFRENDTWKFYRQLAHRKVQDKLFADGGQKFLYAEGGVLALARFTGERALVAVMSVSDRDEVIRLPLGALGAVRFAGERDVFGTPIEVLAGKPDEHSVRMLVRAHKSYLCETIFG